MCRRQSLQHEPPHIPRSAGARVSEALQGTRMAGRGGSVCREKRGTSRRDAVDQRRRQSQEPWRCGRQWQAPPPTHRAPSRAQPSAPGPPVPPTPWGCGSLTESEGEAPDSSPGVLRQLGAMYRSARHPPVGVGSPWEALFKGRLDCSCVTPGDTRLGTGRKCLEVCGPGLTGKFGKGQPSPPEAREQEAEASSLSRHPPPAAGKRVLREAPAPPALGVVTLPSPWMSPGVETPRASF